MLRTIAIALGLALLASGVAAQERDDEPGALEHGWIEGVHDPVRGTLEHGWIEATHNDPPGIHIFPTINDPPGHNIMDGFGNPPRFQDYPPGRRW